MVTETEVAEVLKTIKAKAPAKKPKAPVVKKSPVAKKPKPAPKAKPAPIKHTALPRIARELGIDPKAARAKLRKSHGKQWKSLSDDELRTLIAA
jgi:hypothetical protein